MIESRLLNPDELECAGGFWVEARTTSFRTFLLSFHVVDSIEGDYVHMTCSVGKVVGQLMNYNIGWRAWLMKPTDEKRKAVEWNPVVECEGVGYGWDCDFCERRTGECCTMNELNEQAR